MIDELSFSDRLLSKPVPRGLAVETTLHHFAIVTYTVDPEALRRHVHSRFEPDCVAIDGAPRALVSVVTFFDRDFRFVACPWPRGSFGQTNYRAYVRDTETGDHAAWFFGTCLDSWSVVVPHAAWKLPWHRGRMQFDCRFDEHARRYTTYAVTTSSQWAPARLAVDDTGGAVTGLAGFSSLESGMVLLTHPLRGYFFRRDGRLGSYAIWHPRLEPTVGTVMSAEYPLLDRLELVVQGDRRAVHSVLLQPRIDFTIYLPPMREAGAARRVSNDQMTR